MTIIQFHSTKTLDVPADYRDFFKQQRIANYFGNDSFIEAAAHWLKTDTKTLLDFLHGSIDKCRRFIRSSYKAAHHQRCNVCTHCGQPGQCILQQSRVAILGNWIFG